MLKLKNSNIYIDILNGYRVLFEQVLPNYSDNIPFANSSDILSLADIFGTVRERQLSQTDFAKGEQVK